MSPLHSERLAASRSEHRFATTHWSVVLEASRNLTPQSAEALERLCCTYWHPIYAYVRRRGHPAEDAQDLTQEFFAEHLERDFLSHVDPAKGKFRSFLLASLNHFLNKTRTRAKAVKRGGQHLFISLDDPACEKRYLSEPATDLSPEDIFEQRWALAVFDQALIRLRKEFVAAGKTGPFDALKVFLAAENRDGDYATVGAELGMTPNAVAVAVHRLRRRYRDMVREEVAHTVATLEEIDEELRHLFAVIRG